MAKKQELDRLARAITPESPFYKIDNDLVIVRGLQRKINELREELLAEKGGAVKRQELGSREPDPHLETAIYVGKRRVLREIADETRIWTVGIKTLDDLYNALNQISQ